MSIAPFLRRQLFIPFWIFKDGSPRLRYLKELEHSQYDDLHTLKEKQFNQLKAMLNHAYTHILYYKEKFEEYGLHPHDIIDQKDIKKLPILTKRDIQDNHHKLIAHNFKKESLIPFKTGGSTGEPLTVYWDFRAMERGIASSLRCFKWTGWNIGEPVGRVWGNPPQYTLSKEKLRNTLLDPQIFLDTMNLNDSTMVSFITQWKKTNPTLLHGHSHSLSIFAQFCKIHSINDIKPKGIISTSMVLMPSERDTIECVFNTKVTDLYGCEEVGLIACECEQHQGIHLNMENLYIECIDSEGNQVRPGEEGMIVVTSLINKAMPLIRYKIEDVGSLAENACRCGRTLPLMKGVTGRTADFLVRQDGSLVAGVSLIERTLTAVPGIRQMQIVQEDLDTIVLTIVKNHDYSDKTLNDIKKEFAKVFGNNTNLYCNFADTIVQDRSGKYRFSLSKVYNPYR